MAARRLLIVLVVLLAISTLAAFLIAPSTPTTTDSDSTIGTGPTVEPASTIPQGELLKATIDADTPRIEVVPISLGDQIELTVQSRAADTITIPGLGLTDAVAPEAPAVFDVFADTEGRFPVRAESGGGAGRMVGRLEVRAAKKAKKTAKD